MPAFLAPLAISGISALAGWLGNRGQRSSSGVSKELQPLQADLLAKLRARLANPGEGLEPLKTAATTRLNARYQGAGDKLAARLASRGFGGAGADGRTVRSQVDLDLDRFRGLGEIDTNFAQMELSREDDTIQRIMQMLGQGREQVVQGNRLGGALDAGLSTATTLTTLSRLLKGAGGGGGGGYSPYGDGLS